MLKSKEQLSEYLLNKCEVLSFNKEKLENICEILKAEHEVSIGTSMDMIIRNKIPEQEDKMLFWLTEAIDRVEQTNRLNEYFTRLELKEYPKLKVVQQKKMNNIIIDCFKVADDQWITVKDLNFFMDLRRDSKIRYNENAQRVLKRVVKNGQTVFKLAVNRVAVKAIKQLMINNIYIPNTITLNINPEYDTDIIFKDNKLIIKNLETFDISDGYHRYLAMCSVKDECPDFNINMELRITNFPDEKAQQFIWQEDQKTKMKKVDSESMNSNSFSNSVVDFMTVSKIFYMKDNISKNAGSINYAELSSIINFYYNYAKEYNKKEISDLSKEISEKWNQIIDSYQNLLHIERIPYRMLCVIIHIMRYDLIDAISNYDDIFNLQNQFYKRNTKITKTVEKEIDTYIRKA